MKIIDFWNFKIAKLVEIELACRKSQNDSNFWTPKCVCRAIWKAVRDILANPRSCRCKITWWTRIRCPWTFWRPVEPAILIPGSRSPIFTFFPLFLAPSEISTWFFWKILNHLIFHLQLEGFAKISLSKPSVGPFVHCSRIVPNRGTFAQLCCWPPPPCRYK